MVVVVVGGVVVVVGAAVVVGAVVVEGPAASLEEQADSARTASRATARRNDTQAR
jgi:hypothetical protein